MSDPLQRVAEVGRLLDELGVPWLIGGSVASMIHGEVRATRDADLVAALRLEHAGPLVDRLRDDYYVDLGDVRDAISRRGSFNLIHLGSALKIDVFVPPDQGLHAQKWARAVRVRAGDAGELPVTDPASLALQKLDRFRRGGEVSEQQWRDVLGLMKVQGTALDRAFLDEWAGHMGLEELLARALREAGLEEPA